LTAVLDIALLVVGCGYVGLLLGFGVLRVTR
jgi:hypothetical protein